MTLTPGRDGVERLGHGVRAGHRDEREVGPAAAIAAPGRARAQARRRAPRTSCAPRRRVSSSATHGEGRRDALVAAADGDEQVVGRPARARRNPCPG